MEPKKTMIRIRNLDDTDTLTKIVAVSCHVMSCHVMDSLQCHVMSCHFTKIVAIQLQCKPNIICKRSSLCDEKKHILTPWTTHLSTEFVNTFVSTRIFTNSVS